jgi:hypothetical protein
LQSGCKGGICGHSANAFSNSVSMPIAALGLSGYCNGYWATVAVICNTFYSGYSSIVIWERDEELAFSSRGLSEVLIQFI